MVFDSVRIPHLGVAIASIRDEFQGDRRYRFFLDSRFKSFPFQLWTVCYEGEQRRAAACKDVVEAAQSCKRGLGSFVAEFLAMFPAAAKLNSPEARMLLVNIDFMLKWASNKIECRHALVRRFLRKMQTWHADFAWVSADFFLDICGCMRISRTLLAICPGRLGSLGRSRALPNLTTTRTPIARAMAKRERQVTLAAGA